MCLWNVNNPHHFRSQIVVKSNHDGFSEPFFFLVSCFCRTNAAWWSTPISILRALNIFCVLNFFTHRFFFNHFLFDSTALYTFRHVIELSESRLFSTFLRNNPSLKIFYIRYGWGALWMENCIHFGAIFRNELKAHCLCLLKFNAFRKIWCLNRKFAWGFCGFA